MVTKDLTWQVATSVAPEGQAQIWELRGLDPSPEETWDHLRAFLHLDEDDLQAMLGTIEPLFQRGYDLIVENYAYLGAFPETAALLGWSGGADPQHLAERRRFLAVWLARTLGLDFSHDFARYLFRAGQVHAGHGRRHLHIPSLYVVGSIALMTEAFARILEQAEVRTDVQLRALAGWNKVFILHLQMMLQGYRSALALTEGEEKVKVTVYGRLRSLIGCDTLEIGFYSGQSVLEVLRKFFNYYPHARLETLEIVWESQHHEDARGNPWMEVGRIYRPRAGWRVLRNGRDIAFMTEDQWRLESTDQVAIFPPGR